MILSAGLFFQSVVSARVYRVMWTLVTTCVARGYRGSLTVLTRLRVCVCVKTLISRLV